jgi:acetyl esterase/lipase
MTTTQHIVIPLFPQGAPGSEGWDQVEEETCLPDGLPIVRNVTQPSLTVYPAKNPNGTAVIIAPGGAWHFLAIEHEGRQVAEWLAERGITAFILKYRLFRTGPNIQADLDAFFADRGSREPEMRVMLKLTRADAQQAVRIVRQRAAEWGVDPQRIGFMGFSAGGGVTDQIARNYTPDSRPDFAAPIYAAVFTEVQAPADAPPLFLLCAEDDEMAVNGSLILHKAWRAAKRPVEMHIYASGGHGFAMKKLDLPVDSWIERFEEWVRAVN